MCIRVPRSQHGWGPVHDWGHPKHVASRMWDRWEIKGGRLIRPIYSSSKKALDLPGAISFGNGHVLLSRMSPKRLCRESVLHKNAEVRGRKVGEAGVF